MNLIQLIESFEERVVQDKWSAFVAYAEEFDTAVEELQNNESRDEVAGVLKKASQMMVYEQMLNSERLPFARIVSTEFIQLLSPDYALLEDAVQQLFSDHENEVAYRTAASLAASLMETAQEPLAFNVLGIGEVNKLFTSFINLYESFGRHTSKPQENIVKVRMHINLQKYRTIQGLQPGDCIFRRQSPGIFNPFRDFGHAGIYLGCDDPDADINDCASHKIVHVVSEKVACQLVTLKEFCEPNGKKESFWGAYQVNLTSSERERVVSNALSGVGQFTYKFIGKGYKGPLTYRCDGFVECCYENAAINTPPMSYRGGLFENDNWKTLNPSALRNCLTTKVADTLLCCAFDPSEELTRTCKASDSSALLFDQVGSTSDGSSIIESSEEPRRVLIVPANSLPFKIADDVTEELHIRNALSYAIKEVEIEKALTVNGTNISKRGGGRFCS